MKRPIQWSYGVTTVPARIDELLPRTLASLAAAGFERPHLFIDGSLDVERYRRFGLPMTFHEIVLRTYGNWIQAIWELYVLAPLATRYVVFQDDLVACRNLRQYLETSPYPEKGYLNLYTFPFNEPDSKATGWHRARKRGKGGLGLVFSREALVTLLQASHTVMKPQDGHRGHKSLDGAVVESMNAAGWHEYVHMPSLLQHTGTVSATKNHPHQLAGSFPGEEFDAMQFLPVVTQTYSSTDQPALEPQA